MAKPFDATLKDLIEQHPGDWLSLVGRPAAAVEVIDADVSTVTAAADRVLRVLDRPPWLLHLELETSTKIDPGAQLHWYNTLLAHRHGQLVRTVVVLLRRSADSPRWNGLYQRGFDGEAPYLQFGYGVVRLWQVPVEELLGGGLGILPLAALSAVADPAVPAVVRRIEERLVSEVPQEQAGVLWNATFVLTGLRVTGESLKQLFEGGPFMGILEESSAYEVLLEKGMAKGLAQGMAKGLAQGMAQGKTEGALAILMHLAAKRFGPAPAAVKAALDTITELEHLECLSDRLSDATSWEDLLGTP